MAWRRAFARAMVLGAAISGCGGRTGLEVPPESFDAAVADTTVLDSTVVPDTIVTDTTIEATPVDSAPFDSFVDSRTDSIVVDVGPSDTGPLDRLQISLGELHSCALRADASVWCWGYAELFGGAIGEESPTPRTVDALAGAKQIVAGIDQTCAVMADATVQCLGWAIGGPFTGPPGHSTTPVLVPGLDDVAELALGGNLSCTFACARRTDGTVKCWGCNMYGTLGDGTTTDRATPTLVIGSSGVAQIATRPSSIHACARLDDGTAECWGNNRGEIGDGTATRRLTPTTVIDLSAVSEMATGFELSFARTSDGTVLGWGLGDFGQLGIGKVDSQPTATSVPGLVADRIAVGMYHACAMLTDSSLACWGNNDAGQLGDGTTTERDTPTTIYAKGVVDVALGTFHSCARLDDGSLWCWGSNYHANLGDGVTPSTMTSPTPVRVKGF